MSSLVEEAAFTRRAEQGGAACKTTVSPSFTDHDMIVHQVWSPVFIHVKQRREQL